MEHQEMLITLPSKSVTLNQVNIQNVNRLVYLLKTEGKFNIDEEIGISFKTE